MSRYDLIIFDLDGTLIDSRAVTVSNFRYVLDQLGIPDVPEEQLRSYVGPPILGSLTELVGSDNEKISNALTLFQERQDVVDIDDYTPYRGIPELIALLRAQAIPLVVATSKLQLFAERILMHHGLLEHFERIFGSRKDGSGAGKAGLIADALASFTDVATQNTVMIGDHPADVEGAGVNGVDSIAVSYGYTNETELRAAEPTLMVNSVPALRELLLEEVGEKRV